MNDKEKKAFRIAADFYQRWRETIIETDDQWLAFAEDSGRCAEEVDINHNPLGLQLMIAVVNAIGDLYKDGMKPMPANYFGRDDL